MIPYLYMDNFFFGLQAVIAETIDLLRRLTAYELFWGFALGFLTATILHAFLFSLHPKYIPSILWQDQAISFQKMHKPNARHVYKDSFEAHIVTVNKIKFVFALSGIIIAFLFLLVLLSIF